MKGNRLMLIIAVASGLVATVLAFQFISSSSRAGDAQSEPLVSMIFTVNDLPANHLLDPETDLEVKSVGRSTSAALVQRGVKGDEFDSLRGQRVFAPVPAGMPLLYSHLAPVQDLQLSPGTRAMSIEVDPTSTIGGILVPGDRVDVLVSYRLPKEVDVPPVRYDPENPEAMMAAVPEILGQALGGMSGTADPHQWVAEEVMPNLRVVAVGDQLGKSRQQFPFAPNLGMGRDSNIVTLEVTIPQALSLMQALAGGGNRLQLVLRPPETSGSSGEGALIEGD